MRMKNMSERSAGSRMKRTQFSKRTTPRKMQEMPFDLTKGQPILLCLKQLSHKWKGQEGDISQLKLNDAENQISTIDSLFAFSKDLGIELEFAKYERSNFQNIAFPCILAFDNNSSFIALSCDAHEITLYDNGTRKNISFKDIEAGGIPILLLAKPIVEIPKQTENLHNIRISQVQEAAPKTETTKGSAFRQFSARIFEEHKQSMILLGIATIISNMVMVVLPLYLKIIYDTVIPNSAIETLLALTIGVFIVFCVELGIRYVKLKLVDSIAIPVSSRLQADLLRSLNQSKLQYIPRNTASWHTAFKDLDMASSVVPNLMVAILIDIPFIALVLLLIYSIAGPVVFAPIVAIAGFAIWILAAQNILKKKGADEAALLNKKVDILSEIENLQTVTKAYNLQNGLNAKFERLLNNMVPHSHSMRMHLGMQGQATAMIVQFAIIFAVLIGVYQIVMSNMTVGAMAATTLLVGRVLLPAGNILVLSARFSQAYIALDYVMKLMALPKEVLTNSLEQKNISEGHVSLKNVNFCYEGSDIPVLKNISLEIKPGERVAIIGKSGCGKSTLLQLLSRIYEPTNGKYLIDQFDSAQFSHSEIRSNFVYMPQQTDLFEASIFDNIAKTRQNMSQDDVLSALKIAGGLEMIQNNPEGLGFNVGRNGQKLSGGERQSVGLARSIVNSSKMLLLDEPTSSMDNTTEAQVIRNLNEAIGSRSFIISTHRASLLQMVDRIILMDQGKIISDGPRETVLKKLQTAA